CLLILGSLVVALLASHPVGAESISDVGSLPSPGWKNVLCTSDRLICISKSVTHSLVTNPFEIDVQVNSADDIVKRAGLDSSKYAGHSLRPDMLEAQQSRGLQRLNHQPGWASLGSDGTALYPRWQPVSGEQRGKIGTVAAQGTQGD